MMNEKGGQGMLLDVEEGLLVAEDVQELEECWLLDEELATKKLQV